MDLSQNQTAQNMGENLNMLKILDNLVKTQYLALSSSPLSGFEAITRGYTAKTSF